MRADRPSATVLAQVPQATVRALRPFRVSRPSCAINCLHTTLLVGASRPSCAIPQHDAEPSLWRRDVRDTQGWVPTFRDKTEKAVDFDAVVMRDAAVLEVSRICTHSSSRVAASYRTTLAAAQSSSSKRRTNSFKHNTTMRQNCKKGDPAKAELLYVEFSFERKLER